MAKRKGVQLIAIGAVLISFQNCGIVGKGFSSVQLNGAASISNLNPGSDSGSSTSTTTVVPNPGYDIIVIAGQSNAVGWGGGEYHDSAKSSEIDSRIDQIGRYNGNDLKVIPARDDLDHHASYGGGTWYPVANSGRVGFGMPFARRYVQAGMLLKGRRLLMVPAAAGATGSWQWERQDCGKVLTYNETSPLYCDMLNRVYAAMRQPGQNRVVAVLWAQGEADVAALDESSALNGYTRTRSDYVWRVSTIFKNMREDLSQDAFPILMGQMVPGWSGWVNEGTASSTDRMKALGLKNEITQGFAEIAAASPKTFIADVTGLPSNLEVGVDLDGATGNVAAKIHFSAAAQVELGNRLFSLYAKHAWPNEGDVRALVSASVFDWQEYLVLNPNLISAGIVTKAQAEQHWLEYGAKEGRQANGAFSVRSYLENNADIAALFGTDYKMAVHNYSIYGFNAGYRGVPARKSFGGTLAALGDAVIGNGALKIVTSASHAGAVTGLNFDGQEFINNHDHGRQLQMAVWAYGMGECNNPNEAGAYSDAGASSSRILKVAAGAEGLETYATPAYYIRREENSAGHVCFSPTTPVYPDAGAVQTPDMDFAKKISLNHQGDPTIFAFDSSVIVRRDIAELPARDGEYAFKVNAAAPALDAKFNTFLRYDPKTSTYKAASQAWTVEPLVISTADGRHAMGMYAPAANGTAAVYGWQYGTGTTYSNFTGAASVVFNYRSAQKDSIVSQRVVFVVGTLGDVMKKLPLLIATENKSNNRYAAIQ